MMDYIMYFFVYSFLGWILEVVFHASAMGQLTNRGFLQGPLCPVYGTGMVMMIILLEPYANNIFILFFGSIIICSVLELAAGIFLEKVFGLRWWDYRDEKWNLGGYICLRFSLVWGFGGMIALGIIHRGVEAIVNNISSDAMAIFIMIMTTLLIIDIISTVMDLIGFNKELTSLDEIGEMIKALSDEMTEKIYDETMFIEELKARYDHKLDQLVERISENRKQKLAALPHVKVVGHKESFEKIKNRVKELRK